VRFDGRSRGLPDRGHLSLIVGVDEVGTGSIAGPIVVAAVAVEEGWTLPGLTDSKKLTARKREELVQLIASRAVEQWIVVIPVSDVDQDFQGSLMAGMRKAILNVVTILGEQRPDHIVVDGINNPYKSVPQRAPYNIPVIVEPKADLNHPVVSAASVIAKVFRDQLMTDLDKKYPGYGFAGHKGYPTPYHKSRLAALKPCLAHRRSAGPVKRFQGKNEFKP
jgi:ribonuclease HII